MVGRLEGDTSWRVPERTTSLQIHYKDEVKLTKLFLQTNLMPPIAYHEEPNCSSFFATQMVLV